jgi:CHAT domain-containing protein
MRKILLFALILISLVSSAQKKGSREKVLKHHRKAEASYDKGDYARALKALEKFRKSAAGRLGANHEFIPLYYYTLAKYQLANGLLTDFETHATTATRVATEGSAVQHSILIGVAELYSQSGHYRKAAALLAPFKDELAKDDAPAARLLRARWEVAWAEALTGQGHYNEAIATLQRNAAYFAGRAVRQEVTADEKGALKTQKLSEEEITARAREYMKCLILLGNAYGFQGNLSSADSTLASAGAWSKKNLGKINIEYIRAQQTQADILVRNGNESLPRELAYGTLLNLLKSEYKPSHVTAIGLYEGHLARLLREESRTAYANVKAEYEKMIDKTFPKKSIYPARLRIVEFNALFAKEYTRNLERDALNMLSENAALPPFHPTRIQINQFLYDLAISKKNYAAAEGYLRQIIAQQEELLGPEAPNTHLARVHLANHFLDYTNNLAEAVKIYENSFTRIVEKEIHEKHADHLNILNHLAALYELTDQYKLAAAALDKAGYLARAKYDGQDYQFGEELTQIARLQIKLGNYELAEKNLSEALKILEAFRKDEKKAVYLIKAIETQAVLLGIKGLFDEAEDALARSARIISRSRSELAGLDDLATARELSSLLIQLGQYTKTEKILDGLISEYEKLYGANSIRLVEPLVNRARLLLARGDYTDAEKVAARAHDIARTVYGTVSTKTATTQRMLADIDYLIGDYDQAEQLLTQALASQEKQFGRNHIEVAKTIAQLALAKFYNGRDRAEVERLMLEARDIMAARLGPDNPQYADVLKSVAILYMSQQRFDLALQALTQAETIWRTKTGRKNNINAASIYSLTADIFYQQKNFAKALSFYASSRNIYEKYFSNTHPEYVKIRSKEARVYFMQKDFKQAKRSIEESLANYEIFIKQYFPALSEREKAKYWNTIKDDFEFYNTLAFSKLEDFRDLTGKVYNYQLLTKALLLSASIKIRERILASNDENLRNLYLQWVDKKEYLTQVLSMSAQQLADNNINQHTLASEVEALERELSEKSELFSSGFENKRVTYENVQKSIAKGEVAMEMIRFRHFNHVLTDSVIYVALYVKNDNERPKAVILPNGSRMENQNFRYFRNTFMRKIKDTLSYAVFWQPIERAVGQYTTLYLSPDGVYTQLNLEAISTPDGRYMLDNSNIVILSNTKDLYLRKAKAKPVAAAGSSATLFGNPTFYLTASASRRFTDLPGTEREIAELQALLAEKGWKTFEYTEGSATEERIKEMESPKIFHIATHGFTTPAVVKSDIEKLAENEAMQTDNPLLRTGLLLRGAGDLLDKTSFNYNIENGILTAYEAMNLSLDRTDLVVLSACETGLGEIRNGEGVYGLQRAFLVAGAKVLIMSMFKVDDEATQKLILNFYRKWLNTGNMRQSFVEAKKELRTEYPEPYYWGAFIMIGLE